MEVSVFDDFFVIENFHHSKMIFHFLPILETNILDFFQCINFIINFAQNFINRRMISLTDFLKNLIFLVKNFLNDFLCFGNYHFDWARWWIGIFQRWSFESEVLIRSEIFEGGGSSILFFAVENTEGPSDLERVSEISFEKVFIWANYLCTIVWNLNFTKVYSLFLVHGEWLSSDRSITGWRYGKIFSLGWDDNFFLGATHFKRRTKLYKVSLRKRYEMKNNSESGIYWILLVFDFSH